ncbi:S53 family peptidase [Fodinicola feengrottensis]|uniref:S53 family peptidase n=1 Tax=Fodinicola feengrottensis TaxID=435914 RepID=UPI0013D19D8F|nr:protease pro-enzyme activation domain-containing protein [Fodinicola feengrottensis]
MAHALFRRTAAVAAGLAAIAALAPLTAAASPAAAAARTPLADHGPSVPAGSHRDGPLSTSQRLGLAISLRPHDEAGLTNFVAAVSNPASPAYRHYLTSDQYGRYFGPRQSDVDKVRAYLKDSGLTVTAVSGNRQVVDATGTADQVKAAFGTGISDYAGKNGQHFYANDSAPSVPSSLASTIRGVAGLTNQQAVFPVSTPAGPGGPGGGYTPAQLRTAYSMKSLSASYNGSGQTVGLIEFDAFKQSDLTAWTNYYSQPARGDADRRADRRRSVGPWQQPAGGHARCRSGRGHRAGRETGRLRGRKHRQRLGGRNGQDRQRQRHHGVVRFLVERREMRVRADPGVTRLVHPNGRAGHHDAVRIRGLGSDRLRLQRRQFHC